MRDKAKKYLMDIYLADWAPNPERVPPVGPTSWHVTAPCPLKASRGFLANTDDENDEEEGNAYIIYIICFYSNFVFPQIFIDISFTHGSSTYGWR